KAINEGIWWLAGRHAQVREARADQAESEAAALCGLRGVRNALVRHLPRVSAEDLSELRIRLEVMLCIRVHIALRLVERRAMANCREDVVQSVTFWSGVENFIGDDEWRVMPRGNVEQRLVTRPVIWREVIVQLDKDAIPSEDLLVKRQPVFRVGDQRDQMAA